MCHLQSEETLIHETGIMKLVDFGFTKTLPFDENVLKSAVSTEVPSAENSSHLYMAPEVLRHEPYSYKVRVPYTLFEHHKILLLSLIL